MHAGMWLAVTLACRDHKRSGEDWGSEMPAMAAETGLDFIFSKYVSESLSVEAPVYAMYHYSKAIAQHQEAP